VAIDFVNRWLERKDSLRSFFNPVTILLIVVMAYSSISSGRFNSPMDWFIITVLTLPGIFIALSFHEFAHAFTAYKLGDQTPRFQKRVTLNPARHMDLFGFLCLVFIGFGWGKPVMINPQNFKNPRRDGLLVSLAGVTMNLFLAFLLGAILAIYVKTAPMFVQTYIGDVILNMILFAIRINLILMIFNLIPIPPLDGFNAVTEIFNIKRTELYYKIYQNGFVILLVLILLDAISVIFKYTVTPMFYSILRFFL